MDRIASLSSSRSRNRCCIIWVLALIHMEAAGKDSEENWRYRAKKRSYELGIFVQCIRPHPLCITHLIVSNHQTLPCSFTPNRLCVWVYGPPYEALCKQLPQTQAVICFTARGTDCAVSNQSELTIQQHGVGALITATGISYAGLWGSQ